MIVGADVDGDCDGDRVGDKDMDVDVDAGRESVEQTSSVTEMQCNSPNQMNGLMLESPLLD